MACLEMSLTKRSQGGLSKEGVLIGITICQSTTGNGDIRRLDINSLRQA